MKRHWLLAKYLPAFGKRDAADDSAHRTASRTASPAGSHPARGKRAVAVVTVAALVASATLAVGVDQLVGAKPAGAAIKPAAVGQNLDCPSDTSIYALDTTVSGTTATAHMYQVDIATGATTTTFSKVLPATTTGASAAANQLGIDVTGDAAYYITSNDSPAGGTGTLWDYSNATGVSTAVAQVPAYGQAGAINPANGKYYFAVASASAAVYSYTPGASAAVQVGTWPSNISSGSGDLTFDKAGNGYLLNGGTLNRFTPPAAAGTAPIPTTQLAMGISTSADGVAVGGDGFLYVTANGTSTIQKFNPTTGLLSGSITMSGTTSTTITDAASCSYSSTLAVNKVLPDGRVAPTDQFTLTPGGGGIPASAAATTTGTGTTATGTAGPVFVLPGTSYTITVTNTGQLPYPAANGASFTDSLTNVLDDATYNGDVTATSGTAAYNSTTHVLSWSGALALALALGQVVTVRYTVTVNRPDLGDLQLVNSVVTPPGGNCVAGSTSSGCKATVSDVPPAAVTTGGPLAFTGVTASTQLGFAVIAFALGFGLLLLARRRRESRKS